MIAGGAHGVHFAEAERFNATLLEFLRSSRQGLVADAVLCFLPASGEAYIICCLKALRVTGAPSIRLTRARTVTVPLRDGLFRRTIRLAPA